MTSTNIRQDIRDALAKFDSLDFGTSAKLLLGTLGYNSERVPQGQSGEIDEFITEYPADNPDTNSEREFKEHAESVRLIFQVASEEIAAAASTQQSLFSPTEFEKGRAQSFVFAAAELKDPEYPRGLYARLAREISKRLPMPLVALFRTSTGRLTVAFINRRANKRIADRDVLGDVSIIRQIDTQDPHRAHIDILAELSLDDRLRWMDSNNKPHNFDGLLAAWLNTLDTEALNKRFYDDLFKWFEHAKTQAKFPKKGAKVLNREDHIIRLITRMLFVWFFKEKGLIAKDLFIEGRIANLLRDYDHDNGDSYYRAVLQNLFFATLNAEIAQRGFSSGQQRTHRLPTFYRYRAEMADSDRLEELFSQTPFINGGLFECLDSEKAIRNGGWRIDCFTDNLTQRQDYSIPNRLFFGENGLIDLFDRYKFTVEENTPVEQEVALDPELLGKVFENLLAAYNPETRETARKQTGSYYTPRAVVDYMVDEALTASLSEKVHPHDSDMEYLRDRLRYLLDYADAFNDADTLFTESERKAIVRAIAEIRVLDPAVGSGAFPMSILHKLTLALRRLDEDNEHWELLQKEMAVKQAQVAFDTSKQREREVELKEISDTFERYRDSDFGRKLYLTQNSIFGVDIQPVATQIAKLRFFISLAIEQQVDAVAENFGIRPLPNLETRFVAANTLLALRDVQTGLTSGRVLQLQQELQLNRERHFHARDRGQKLRYAKVDGNLRRALAAELVKIGLETADAGRISEWDPYEQNAGADWFDVKYMFGMSDGFDVVIGNPPYVRSEAGGDIPYLRARIMESGQYETLFEKWDLFIPFVEKGYQLLKPGGFTTMIISDAYCHARYAKRSREYFLKNALIARLDFLSSIQVFEAGVHNITYLFQKADGSNNKPERRIHTSEFGGARYLPTMAQRELTERVFFPEDVTANRFTVRTIRLRDICYISYGLRPSSKKKASRRFVTADLTSVTRDKIHCRPFVEGKHLNYWLPATNLWIEYGTNRAPSQFYAPTFEELYEVDEKILVPRSPGAYPKASYDNQHLIYTPSSVGFVLWHDLSGVRNNSIRKQARYVDEKPHRPDLPKREYLEETSFRFALKFLLGLMNSRVVHNFLRANRRSNIHLYPEDWKNIQIPNVPLENQGPIVMLVDEILVAKATNSSADTSTEESELNRLVYELYGLTDEEIAIIEDGTD